VGLGFWKREGSWRRVVEFSPKKGWGLAQIFVLFFMNFREFREKEGG